MRVSLIGLLLGPRHRIGSARQSLAAIGESRGVLGGRAGPQRELDPAHRVITNLNEDIPSGRGIDDPSGSIVCSRYDRDASVTRFEPVYTITRRFELEAAPGRMKR